MEHRLKKKAEVIKAPEAGKSLISLGNKMFADLSKRIFKRSCKTKATTDIFSSLNDYYKAIKLRNKRELVLTKNEEKVLAQAILGQISRKALSKYDKALDSRLAARKKVSHCKNDLILMMKIDEQQFSVAAEKRINKENVNYEDMS